MFRRNKIYWVFSSFFFFYFFSFSSSMSLFGIWLGQAGGLDGTGKGIVFAINSIGALCIHPIYGFISDKIGLKKHLLSVIIGLLILAGPFFQFIYSPLLAYNIYIGAIVGSIYLGAAFTSGNAAVETFIEKIGRKYSFEYGESRMFGSLGWAVATFFAGQTFNINPNLNFWVCSGSAVILAVLLFMSKVERSDSNINLTAQEDSSKVEPFSFKEVVKLVRSGKFWSFVMYILGITCIFTVYDQQFPVYFASLFDSPETGNRMYGYLNSIQVFFEAAFMFMAPVIVNRIGAKKGLLLAGLLMFTRITCSGLADGIPMAVAATKLIHSLEVPVMFISIFKYIRVNFDARVTSTMYLVGYQFSGALGAAVISPIAGRLYDVIGFSQTYLWLGAYVLLFTVISMFTLRNTNKLS
ncbi:oligosaccharide MFS transporter [Paenibacillus crassostreae]|uniref:Galactoside permease n=1 Tax=Paenibacillus crassostreae TaxID=1763538 RepID=A0A167FID6_9BACL|nr:oligosaccharide MFS transporter [Paenibacillus crassostreae]AOZ94375.1 MFS transporter [Paenibacillus crassostreae]OAB76588.1 galactoside permease [Paenibacillus crassostreae]